MLKEYYGVEKILYVIIAVIGVPVNLVAIFILSQGKCGLSKCTTRDLVAMAAADLLLITTEVIFRKINDHYFPMCFLDITIVCRTNLALTYIAVDCSVWFTVTFTFDRYVAICCQKLRTKYCTEKTAATVLATTGILFCLKNVPFYFSRESREIIDNVPWFCVTKSSYYTELGWVGFDWLDACLNPLLPFAVILPLNALTVRYVLVASRVRKCLKVRSKGGNLIDPEMQNRRKSVVLLFTISGSFIFLWLTFVVEFVYYQITGTGGEWNDPELVFHEAGFFLTNISCCTNTFIYTATQTKFREQLKKAVKYLVGSVRRNINRVTT
ncbi:probable G-protein coupled receptor 139 [Mobula hypostoma]|uniref:probable G-protein coupled receptor 139 n=1 Tax=Mobula hypostoma TaxID=723540 RepID=UPI002FC2B33E